MRCYGRSLLDGVPESGVRVKLKCREFPLYFLSLIIFFTLIVSPGRAVTNGPAQSELGPWPGAAMAGYYFTPGKTHFFPGREMFWVLEQNKLCWSQLCLNYFPLTAPHTPMPVVLTAQNVATKCPGLRRTVITIRSQPRSTSG